MDQSPAYRSQDSMIWSFTSLLGSLTCGVPQGSVLAPALFFLYLLYLGFSVRSLWNIFNFFSEPSLKLAIYAVITFRLYYCNTLYYGISKTQISSLHVVWNAAITFLTSHIKLSCYTPFEIPTMAAESLKNFKSCFFSKNHYII